LLPQKNVAVGFFTNYVHNPIETGLNSGKRTGGLVDQLITTDFLLSVGLADWL